MISSQFGQSRFSIIMAIGTAQGLAMPDARKKPDAILFDFHASAPAITALAALQLIVDKVEIDREIGRKPFHQSDQSLAVGLAGRAISQHRSEYTGKPETRVTA